MSVAVRGVCVVGGVHSGGHVWQGGMRGRYYEIRSMSGRYTSYWNAFLLGGFLFTLKPPYSISYDRLQLAI